LVLGGGGREHALVWSLAREAGVEAVIVAPGSDAIAEEPKVRCVPAVSATDPAAVLALATAEDMDLVVVGPEAPLAAGVVDVLEEAGVPTFGPIKAAARIEWSKAFCREVAAAAGVRMARGEAFWALEPALAFARGLAAAPGSCGVVVKADGLMAARASPSAKISLGRRWRCGRSSATLRPWPWPWPWPRPWRRPRRLVWPAGPR
jgi:Phosphoribosylamine-glycine ligase